MSLDDLKESEFHRKDPGFESLPLFVGYLVAGIFILIQAGILLILTASSINYQTINGIIINVVFISILFMVGFQVCKVAYTKR
jgi:hypothetical protein